MPKEKKRADNVGSSRSSSRVEKKNTIKKGTEAQQDFQRMMEKLGETNVPVLATGGYSKLISSGIGEMIEVNEKLTLEGLRIIAKLNL